MGFVFLLPIVARIFTCDCGEGHEGYVFAFDTSFGYSCNGSECGLGTLSDSGMTNYNTVNADECQSFHGDGCSIPLGLPYFYKNTFKSACHRHDICYACARSSRYRFSRKRCDDIFKRNMHDICERRRPGFQRNTCYIFKENYYHNVRLWGFASFRHNSPWWCSFSTVSRCIY